jgi:hypothetical protein
VENQTGRPLQRATIVIQGNAGAGAAQSTRTNLYGAFEFTGLPGGAYLVSAARQPFAPVQYGQKRWHAAGTPVLVEENGSVFLDVRMQRFGAISGYVGDENDVGLPDLDVVAYRNTRPPQVAARAKTDDRGIYRLWGLDPGVYIVRTLARKFEDWGYVPTFSKQTERLEDAYLVDANLDQQTDNVNLRAIPGRLYTVAGRVLSPIGPPVTLTIVSDMGSESVVADSTGHFEFPDPQAPGQYELYGTSPAQGRYGAEYGLYMPLALDRDVPEMRVSLSPIPSLRVVIEDPKGVAIDTTAGYRFSVRRRTLSADLETQTIRLGRTLQLQPGRWELLLTPPPSQYVSNFSGPPDDQGRSHPEGWNTILLTASAMARFVVSTGAGSIHGVVTASGQPAVGAPVFLEPYDPVQRTRVADLRTVRADERGQYRFSGLAPGAYRILSSFDFRTPEPLELNAVARTMNIESGDNQTADLDLYVVR